MSSRRRTRSNKKGKIIAKTEEVNLAESIRFQCLETVVEAYKVAEDAYKKASRALRTASEKVQELRDILPPDVVVQLPPDLFPNPTVEATEVQCDELKENSPVPEQRPTTIKDTDLSSQKEDTPMDIDVVQYDPNKGQESSSLKEDEEMILETLDEGASKVVNEKEDIVVVNSIDVQMENQGEATVQKSTVSEKPPIPEQNEEEDTSGLQVQQPVSSIVNDVPMESAQAPSQPNETQDFLEEHIDQLIDSELEAKAKVPSGLEFRIETQPPVSKQKNSKRRTKSQKSTKSKQNESITKFSHYVNTSSLTLGKEVSNEKPAALSNTPPPPALNTSLPVKPVESKETRAQSTSPISNPEANPIEPITPVDFGPNTRPEEGLKGEIAEPQRSKFWSTVISLPQSQLKTADDALHPQLVPSSPGKQKSKVTSHRYEPYEKPRKGVNPQNLPGYSSSPNRNFIPIHPNLAFNDNQQNYQYYVNPNAIHKTTAVNSLNPNEPSLQTFSLNGREQETSSAADWWKEITKKTYTPQPVNAEESALIEDFIKYAKPRLANGKCKQADLAAEIVSLSNNTCKMSQGSVSTMMRRISVPRPAATRTAIGRWIDLERQKIEGHHKGN